MARAGPRIRPGRRGKGAGKRQGGSIVTSNSADTAVPGGHQVPAITPPPSPPSPGGTDASGAAAQHTSTDSSVQRSGRKHSRAFHEQT